MSAPLFTFRQLPTVSLLLAEHQVKFDDVMREAGFSNVGTAEITAPLAKVQALLELAAKRCGSSTVGIDPAQRNPPRADGGPGVVGKRAPNVCPAPRRP